MSPKKRCSVREAVSLTSINKPKLSISCCCVFVLFDPCPPHWRLFDGNKNVCAFRNVFNKSGCQLISVRNKNN